MAQIFTSHGKGVKLEMLHLPKRNPIEICAKANKPAQANPIGIQNEGKKNQSLSCVGIAHSQHNNTPAESAHIEATCVFESELDFSVYDPKTGV